MTIKVLIADDHPLFRRGVRDLLEATGEYHCIEAADGREALNEINKGTVHIAVLDLSMPLVDGFEVINQASSGPDSPYFVILTMHDDSRLIERAFDLGASAYLLKEYTKDELLKCLSTIYTDQRYLSHSIANNPRSDQNFHDERFSLLTVSEQRIVKLVGQYKTSREIAEQLGISIRTVQNHRNHITEKLNLRGRHALLHFAVELLKSPLS